MSKSDVWYPYAHFQYDIDAKTRAKWSQVKLKPSLAHFLVFGDDACRIGYTMRAQSLEGLDDQKKKKSFSVHSFLALLA